MTESREYRLDSTLSHSPDQPLSGVEDPGSDTHPMFNFDLTPIFLDTEGEDAYEGEVDTEDTEGRCGVGKRNRVVCISSREITLSLNESSLYARRKATVLHRAAI